MWRFRDMVIPNVALNAVAGRPKEEYGLEPQGLDEIRPGCYNVDERVKDMNAGGILASICFPSFPGLRRSVVRHRRSRLFVWRWCRPTTIGMSRSGVAPTLRDSSRWRSRSFGTRRRVRPRCGAVDEGVHALTFSENPAAMGYPSFHDDYWTPLWEALVDTDTVMNVHIGSSGRLAITRRTRRWM